MPRTFNGCSTCRSRKVKCDEHRPKCGPCIKRGLSCGGFLAKIQYVFYDPSNDSFKWPAEQPGSDTSSSSRRRPLCSESERKSMSEAVVRAVTYDTLDGTIESLDQSRVPYGHKNHLTYDPFGIFTTGDVQPKTPSPYASPSLHGSLGSQAILEEPETNDTLPNSLYISEFEEILPTFDGSNLDLVVFSEKQASRSALMLPFPESFSPNIFDDIFSPDTLSSLYIQLPWENPNQVEPVPLQTSCLLDHYKLQMVQLFSPKGGKKLPWSVLHLPNAVATLSELTLWGKTDHARSSLFYACLAVSAFNLDRIHVDNFGSTDYWWRIGDGLRERAMTEIKISLSRQIAGPKQSKYKDLLMALLTLVTISVVSGRQTEARNFLLDAEHLICIRGIPKPIKSRKVRLLHQIYLFLRVFEESTHIYPSPTEVATCTMSPEMTAETPSLRFPSLHTHRMRLGKTLGESNGTTFESELIGRSTQESSLFSDIYGIPISLLALLSQATCLANDMEWATSINPGEFTTLSFQSRKKTLEDAILNWKLDENGAMGNSETEAATNGSIIHHLVNAIHGALIVYFYRRIYDLNPIILQPYVKNIIDELTQCEQEKLKLGVIYNGVPWPGFIAATEALDVDLQQRILHWLRDSAQSSGFRNFDVAADVAQRVWKSNASGGSHVSWVELVREEQMTLVLT